MKAFLPFCFCALLLLSTSCVNRFAYDKNDWKFVTKTIDQNPKTFFIDENRTICEGNICKAWTKMEFDREEIITFTSDKPEQGSVSFAVKKIDAMVWYNCLRRTSTVISYQLYDRDGKFVYSNWPNKPLEQVIKSNSADADLYKHLCK